MFKCLAVLAAIVTTPLAIADQEILDRSNKILSKLEVMNNLGLKCETELKFNGIKGASSKDCEKFLKNMQGKYIESIGVECKELSAWHEEQRQVIFSNANLAVEQPQKAEGMVLAMKSVQKSCNPENYSAYPYLTKPINTINALTELE